MADSDDEDIDYDEMIASKVVEKKVHPPSPEPAPSPPAFCTRPY